MRAHLPQGTLVAFAGGKDARDTGAIWKELDKAKAKAKYADMVLAHGGGPGAELIAAKWAESRNVDQVVCCPDWNAHGKAAPFRRNDELLNLLPKGVIAFPGSGITENLIDKALAAYINGLGDRGHFDAVQVAPGNSGDIPDEAGGVRAVVLGVAHPHSGRDGSEALKTAKDMLLHRGSTPRWTPSSGPNGCLTPTPMRPAPPRTGYSPRASGSPPTPSPTSAPAPPGTKPASGSIPVSRASTGSNSSGVRIEDGARAWRVIRLLPAYRQAWFRRRPQPGLPEQGPFPVRLQTAADLTAARFGLYAWEDPFEEDGPASPFWAVTPMVPAAAGPRATPLTGDAAAAGLSAAGLGLGDGSMVLKLENGGGAVQFILQPGGRFGPSDGVLAQHDLFADPRAFFARLRDARALGVGKAPLGGGGREMRSC